LKIIMLEKNKKNYENKYDALTIAKYLLSLDKDRKYFNDNFNDKITKNEITLANTIKGNFRLNQILYLLQISHYQKYKQLLFKDKLYAWDNGVVIYRVYTHFQKLYHNLDNQKTQDISEETKEFIDRHFDYLKDIPDEDLQEFSYTDPVWHSTWNQSLQPEIKLTNKENQEIYQRFCPRWFQELGL